jgi:hypothetical protein
MFSIYDKHESDMNMNIFIFGEGLLRATQMKLLATQTQVQGNTE